MEIQLFNSPQFGDVRMSADENGNPLFLASDVARALGYSNPRDAVAKHCKSDGVAICDVIDNIGRPQHAKFITEGNLYRLIARSNLPEAEKFENWIFDDVVPQIRKTGGYIPVSEQDTEQEILAKAVLISQKTIEHQKQKIQVLEGQKKMLEQENETLAPKAAYTDEVLLSSTTYTHTQMAKELNFRSVNAFVAECTRRNIMYKQSGMWMLYAKYSGKGYMKTRTTPYRCSDGSTKTNTITVWTEEGRRFLHEHFNVAFQPIEVEIPFEQDV